MPCPRRSLLVKLDRQSSKYPREAHLRCTLPDSLHHAPVCLQENHGGTGCVTSTQDRALGLCGMGKRTRRYLVSSCNVNAWWIFCVVASGTCEVALPFEDERCVSHGGCWQFSSKYCSFFHAVFRFNECLNQYILYISCILCISCILKRQYHTRVVCREYIIFGLLKFGKWQSLYFCTQSLWNLGCTGLSKYCTRSCTRGSLVFFARFCKTTCVRCAAVAGFGHHSPSLVQWLSFLRRFSAR